MLSNFLTDMGDLNTWRGGHSVDGDQRNPEEWGDLVGTTRESVNKQLRQWTEAGIIRIDDGYLVILNPVELEKLAGAVLY